MSFDRSCQEMRLADVAVFPWIFKTVISQLCLFPFSPGLRTSLSLIKCTQVVVVTCICGGSATASPESLRLLSPRQIVSRPLLSVLQGAAQSLQQKPLQCRWA